MVGTMSVGYDHIDLKACADRGIKVGFTPDVLTNSVAELTVALLLATSRRLKEGRLGQQYAGAAGVSRDLGSDKECLQLGACAHLCACIPACVCVCVCVCVHTHERLRVCARTLVCSYAYLCVRMCVRMCVCVCVCVCVAKVFNNFLLGTVLFFFFS